MRFDLTDLRLFVHAVESGSITAGAERAHLALASASARLRGMEDLLGVPLLQRNRHGIEMTEAGRSLLQHARSMLLQFEKMRADLGEYATGLKGQIRLLANTAALSEHLPQALAGYLTQHPNVNVELEERPSKEIVHALHDGVADIGVFADTADSVGLEVFPFRSDRLCVIASPRHALAKSIPVKSSKTRRGVTLAEIADYDFVGLAGNSALQEYIGERAAAIGRRLRYRLRLPGFEGVCRMVSEGVGIAIVSDTAAIRHAQTLRLRSLPLDEPWALRQLLIGVRQMENLTMYARSLVEALRLPG